jgi:uncharacterized SAM-binding protein YcdF (DUF218 family)
MSDSFFYLSKILWIIVSPDSLFVILLSLCLLLLLAGKTKKATILLGVLVFCTLFLSVFPVGEWMLYPLEKRFQHNPELPERVDGIMVLGGSVIPDLSIAWQQLETNQAHERLSSFLQLAQRYPEARLVFSGGNASLYSGRPTEAQSVESYFLASGIAPDRLIVENRARNTAENVSYALRLVDPRPEENWIVITTAFHMPRAMGVFCRHNWRVRPYPVDHRTLPGKLLRPGFSLARHASDLVQASHEWLGLLAYYLGGETAQLLPGECDDSA